MQPSEKEASIQSSLHSTPKVPAADPGTVLSSDAPSPQTPAGWRCSEALGACGGGAALQQQGVAAVTYAHRLGVGGQGQLVAGAGVTEDVATVSAVVLEDKREAVTEHAVLPGPHTQFRLAAFQSSFTTSSPSPRDLEFGRVPLDEGLGTFWLFITKLTGHAKLSA